MFGRHSAYLRGIWGGPTFDAGADLAPNYLGDSLWLGKLRRLSKCRWAWKSTCTPALRAN